MSYSTNGSGTYMDLAKRLVVRVRGIEKDSDGDLRMPCPLAGHTTYLMPTALPDGDAIWCSDGPCEPADVEAALRWLAQELPEFCQDLQRREYGHDRECLRC